MINSLELYERAIMLAKNDPQGININSLKNYYLQLTTMIFYELTTRKNSPLISALCRMYRIELPLKNLSLSSTPQFTFNLPTSFDLCTIIYGLNVAISENLSSCAKVFDSNAKGIFRGMELSNEGFQTLATYFTALDEALGRFCAVEVPVERIIEKRIEVPVERIIEKRVEVPVERIVEKRVEVPVEKISDAQEKDLMQSLSTLAQNRHDDEEKILEDIKKLQLTLQDELPRLQGALKNISEIRDGIEYKTLEEPIYQLMQLFSAIDETAQRHPQEDRQKGYDNLIRRCKSFSRYVEQSLEMLGAKLINETNVLFDPSKHKATNIARPSNSATVSKVLSVGLICKGQVRHKAEVEITEPAAPSRGISVSEFYKQQRR